MTELEALKEQRKEIDKRIKELTTETIYCRNTKFYRDTNPGIANYNYIVAVKIPEKRNIGMNVKEGSRYSTVCRAETKEECIQALANVSNALNALYEQLTQEIEK
jgi:tryptophanyl-tRNA synthetase